MLADSLISSRKAKNILLITADTYTKLIDPHDRSLKTIFGDAATASCITYSPDGNGISVFEFGTDGTGAEKLIARHTGINKLTQNNLFQPDLYMDGTGIFNFTLQQIPQLVENLLEKMDFCINDIDLYIFHQANKFILEHLRQKIGISPQRFFIHMTDIGNTVSSSIPIALYEALKNRKIRPGYKVMLVGFGVGLSWAATLVEY